MNEFIEACNESAFANLMINIADATLKNPLRRDHDEDGHGALWDVHRAPARAQGQQHAHYQGFRRAQGPQLVEEGMASSTEAAARQFLELNSELEGSAHHSSDNLLSMTLLDTLAAHLPDAVRVYNTGKINKSK
eukprot:3733185-Pleurochrysis_carterae.AAC.1